MDGVEVIVLILDLVDQFTDNCIENKKHKVIGVREYCRECYDIITPSRRKYDLINRQDKHKLRAKN